MSSKGKKIHATYNTHIEESKDFIFSHQDFIS